MHAVGTGKTDVGRTRKNNEDRFVVDNDLGVFIVADGMGGHNAGNEAAELAVETAADFIENEQAVIERIRRGEESPLTLVSIAREALETASRRVYKKATSDSDYAGMGCTMTILLVGGRYAAMAHVGDTRLYLVRGDEVHQLSTDHTLASDLAKAGIIPEEKVERHKYSGVLTRVVGSQEIVKVDTLMIDISPNDRFLLCSDGLSRYLMEDGLLEEHFAVDDDDEVAGRLVEYANSEGGNDNITVIVATIELDGTVKPHAQSLNEDAQIKLEALSSVFLFENLGLARLTRVVNASNDIERGAGEILIESGSELSKMLVVVRGVLEVSRDGKVLTKLGPGDHVGALTLLAPRTARASVRTLEPSRVMSLDAQSFKELVRRRPWLGVKLLERLGRELTRELTNTRDQLDEESDHHSGVELTELV